MNNSKIQEMYLFIEISFEQLFNIFPQRLTFIQTQNAELSYIELCFADHTSKPVFFYRWLENFDANIVINLLILLLKLGQMLKRLHEKELDKQQQKKPVI